MTGAPDDAESSSGDDRPRFRQIAGNDAEAAGAPQVKRSRRGNTRDFKAALQRQLDGASSSDDEGPGVGRARRPRTAVEPGAGAKKTERRKRKDPASAEAGEAGRAKRGKASGPAAPSDAAFEAEKPERAPRRSRKASYEEDPGASFAAPASTGPVTRRRIARKGPQSRVEHEARQAAAEGPGQQEEAGNGAASGSDNEARFRTRTAHGGAGGAGGRKKGGRDGADSGSENEPEEDEVKSWTDDLRKRADDDGRVMRTAFSIKECPAVAIRSLQPACFLGGRRLQEGGRPLFDDEGKANLHFLLGTYSAVQREKERRKQSADDAEEAVDSNADLKYLKWLVRQAREFKLINKSELRRGKISAKRMEFIRKLGDFSLRHDCNLAETSDYEREPAADALAKGDGKKKATPRIPAKFPERKAASQEGSSLIQERLRSHVVTRQNDISVSSSHDVDLDKVREVLIAPTLSFDWEDKDDEDEEGGLEVALPESKIRDSKRSVFKDQLRRSVSFHQAKNLARSDTQQSMPSLTRLQSGSVDAGNQAEEPPPAESTTEGHGSTSKSSTPAEAAVAPPGPEKPHAAVSEGQAPREDAAEACETPGQAVEESNVRGSEALPGSGSNAAAEPPVGRPTPAAPSPAMPTLPAEVVKADTAMTQEWPDNMHEITPTQAWAGGSLWSNNDKPGEPEPSQAAPKVTEPPRAEISPTMPFVEPAHPEISPTMPFVPEVEGRPEISPTMPFVPEGCDGNGDGDSKAEDGGRAGLAGGEPPQTEVPKASAQEGDAAKDPADPPPKQRKLKRSASIMSEDSPSASDDDAAAYGSAAEALEADSVEDAKRRKAEREWLRHKRRNLRKEEERKRNAKVKSGLALGVSVGVKALVGEDDDDSALLGGLKSSALRRPSSFLLKK